MPSRAGMLTPAADLNLSRSEADAYDGMPLLEDADADADADAASVSSLEQANPVPSSPPRHEPARAGDDAEPSAPSRPPVPSPQRRALGPRVPHPPCSAAPAPPPPGARGKVPADASLQTACYLRSCPAQKKPPRQPKPPPPPAKPQQPKPAPPPPKPQQPKAAPPPPKPKQPKASPPPPPREATPLAARPNRNAARKGSGGRGGRGAGPKQPLPEPKAEVEMERMRSAPAAKRLCPASPAASPHAGAAAPRRCWHPTPR